MGELEQPKRFFCRLFRRTGPVTLETEAGKVLSGRGVVTAMKRTAGEWGGVRHELGTLSRPLYRFLGDLPPEQGSGGILTQGKRSYRVLESCPLLLGEEEICTKMILERRDDDEEQ